MLELWASLKVIEAFIGYGIFALIVLAIIGFIMYALISDWWKFRKKKK